MTISLGYRIPSFTYPGGPEAIFGTVVAQLTPYLREFAHEPGTVATVGKALAPLASA